MAWENQCIPHAQTPGSGTRQRAGYIRECSLKGVRKKRKNWPKLEKEKKKKKGH